MASTWSALKIELLETGANSGTWGTLTNANLGDAVLGEAITGSATVDFASDADVTVTLTDVATTQSARNLRLNITESGAGIGSVRNLILGSGCQIEKFYLVRNNGTGAKTIKNTSGTGISVPASKSTLVYNDGTNVVDGASYFTSLTLGSALPVASGGTGLTAGTSGGVLAYTASGTLTSSAALTQYGVVYGGGAGAVPVATANGTTGQAFIATTSGAPSWGTLPVAGGGTGLTAGTSGGVLAYTASGTLASSGALTASALVLGGGAGVAPTPMGSLGTTTTVLHGNAGGAPTFGAVSLTADVSGALPAANGGTGVANNAAMTVTGSGNFAYTRTLTAATNVTFPTTGTLATLGGSETLSNKTLTAPALGTPASGTLSSCTVDGTDAVGFRNIPINSKSVAYTTVLADSGKVIFHPSTDANVRTFTIDSNANVAYALGTAITFINMTSQVVTIAITTDTMYLSSAGTTGSRSLAQYGSATAIKMTSTTWLISGSGLT